MPAGLATDGDVGGLSKRRLTGDLMEDGAGAPGRDGGDSAHPPLRPGSFGGTGLSTTEPRKRRPVAVGEGGVELMTSKAGDPKLEARGGGKGADVEAQVYSLGGYPMVSSDRLDMDAMQRISAPKVCVVVVVLCWVLREG